MRTSYTEIENTFIYCCAFIGHLFQTIFLHQLQCLMIYTLHLQNEDVSMPLLSKNWDDHSSQSSSFVGSAVGESSNIQTNRSNTSPRSHTIADSGRIYPGESYATQGMHNPTLIFVA